MSKANPRYDPVCVYGKHNDKWLSVNVYIDDPKFTWHDDCYDAGNWLNPTVLIGQIDLLLSYGVMKEDDLYNLMLVPLIENFDEDTTQLPDMLNAYGYFQSEYLDEIYG